MKPSAAEQIIGVLISLKILSERSYFLIALMTQDWWVLMLSKYVSSSMQKQDNKATDASNVYS